MDAIMKLCLNIYFWEIYIQELPQPNTRKGSQEADKRKSGHCNLFGEFHNMNPVMMPVILSMWFTDLIPLQCATQQRKKQPVHLISDIVIIMNTLNAHSQTESDETACEKGEMTGERDRKFM